MPVSPQTLEGLRQAGIQNEQEGITEQDRVAMDFRATLEDMISVLGGLGHLCTDIDELIDMLRLAQKNDSQLYLVMSHLAPKRMRPPKS